MTPTVRSLALGAFLAATASGAAVAQTDVQRADPYFTSGLAAVDESLRLKPNTRRAKNVILFVGDGMGVSTVTAARIFEGQSRGTDGESNVLAFERLPYTALSKTYSTDTQTSDSAATATAMTTGVKTRNRSIAVSAATPSGDCSAALANRVETLAETAKARGKAVGVVTTTRITHATPAAAYAHSAHRDWEGDGDLPAAAAATGCVDIARQLIEARFDVALGGGRSKFLPQGAGGGRKDGRDLTRAWTEAGGVYVADAAALATVDLKGARPLLGLFSPDHVPYEVDRATQGAGVPTLTEMTRAALARLKHDPDGYFLLVEGGKIDHASHANDARRALSETAEFAAAIRATLETVDLKNTLVVVTADHSHGLVISGYAARNAPILGLAGNEGEPATARDGKPYEVLSYATGPGGAVNAPRRTPDEDDHLDPALRQSALVPLGSAAHAGEDVAIYAGGPYAHLFRGVVEQSYIYHVMRRALGFDRAR